MTVVAPQSGSPPEKIARDGVVSIYLILDVAAIKISLWNGSAANHVAQRRKRFVSLVDM